MSVKQSVSARSDPAPSADGVKPISVWVVIAAWTVPALLTTFETMMFSRSEGRPIALWRAFLGGASGWYVWAASTPLIAQLARRFPLRLALRSPLTRPLPWRAIAVHVAAFLLVDVSASVVWAAAATWVRPVRFAVAFGNWFIAALPFAVLVYAAVVSICYSLVDRAQLRDRERDAARLAQQLSEAQLASLRMQLRPHFLFNSLNAIMALVRDGESSRAIDALELLGDMLRVTLRSGPSHEVSLAEEVAFTRRYLEMEQLRFGERLRVTFDIPPDLLDAAVPLFVLQPFVENAIKHGILDRRRGGTIAIAAMTDDVRLRLSVRDDGVGLATGWDDQDAGRVGLANARTRLLHLYDGAATLDVGTGPDGTGVAVEIALPLGRTHPPPRTDAAAATDRRPVYAAPA
jgi:signal transduction histidine kinase